MTMNWSANADEMIRNMHDVFDIDSFINRSNNQFKSGKVYHRDGTTTEWRNYAIIKTEEREFKAPILEEEV